MDMGDRPDSIERFKFDALVSVINTTPVLNMGTPKVLT